MEFKGNLVAYEPYSGKITFNIGRLDADSLQHVYALKDTELKIEFGEYRKKRSQSANAYFHKLVSLIADKLNTDNLSIKNGLIRDYGQYEYIDGVIPTYLVKTELVEAMLMRDDIHFTKIGFEGDRVKLAVMRGSHTYNSKEMARLIDGAVQDAKRLGIETLPPDEIEQMIKALEAKENKGETDGNT